MLSVSDTKTNGPSLSLEALTAPLASKMDSLNDFLQEQIGEFEPELQDMVRYCLKNSGKRIRPTLLFFSGWPMGEEVHIDLIRAAAVVELIHLATLVHDDILDGATIRHKRKTVAEEYGVDVAVLLGDALFAHALKLAADFPTVEVCRLVSKATRQVCSGEIKQTIGKNKAQYSIEDYRGVVHLKTAELFRVSTILGGTLGGYEADYVAALSDFGVSLGIAYQIFDDLADFVGHEENMGKTLGTDIASGKLTLPLILLLEKLGEVESKALMERIRAGEAVEVSQLVRSMEANGVIDAVFEYFLVEVNEALALLDDFSDLAPTKHLKEIVLFVREQATKLVAS